MTTEALKKVQKQVRSSISWTGINEKHVQSSGHFQFDHFFFGELQMTHQEAVQSEQLVKKSAQLATSSSRCA